MLDAVNKAQAKVTVLNPVGNGKTNGYCQVMGATYCTTVSVDAWR